MNEHIYDEDVIDLYDLFLNIIKKWRSIVIALLVGLLLGSVFSLYKYKSNDVNSKIAQMKSNITDTNEFNVRKYKDSVDLYESKLNNSERSVLLNLDCYSVDKGFVKYSFIGDDEASTYLNSEFNTYLSNEDLWKNILDKYQEYEIDTLLECIKIDIDVQTLDENNNVNNFKFNVYGKSEAFVNDALSNLESIINSFASDSKRYYTINKLKQSVTKGYDSSLYDIQKKDKDSRENLLKLVNTLKTNLSADESTYYGYTYDHDNFVKTKSSFSLKWPLLFGIAFSIMMAGIHFLRYLFVDEVRTEDEITNKYQIPLLATLNVDGKEYNGIDKIINSFNRVNYNSEDYLKTIIKSLKNKKLLISNNYDSVNDMLANIGKDIVICGSLETDDNSIKKLHNSDGVVLVLKPNETKNSSIRRQIEIVKNFGKNIVGYISLR